MICHLHCHKVMIVRTILQGENRQTEVVVHRANRRSETCFLIFLNPGTDTVKKVLNPITKQRWILSEDIESLVIQKLRCNSSGEDVQDCREQLGCPELKCRWNTVFIQNMGNARINRPRRT